MNAPATACTGNCIQGRRCTCRTPTQDAQPAQPAQPLGMWDDERQAPRLAILLYAGGFVVGVITAATGWVWSS